MAVIKDHKYAQKSTMHLILQAKDLQISRSQIYHGLDEQGRIVKGIPERKKDSGMAGSDFFAVHMALVCKKSVGETVADLM